MPVTVAAINQPTVVARAFDGKSIEVTISGDSTYATGGTLLSAAQFGLTQIMNVRVNGCAISDPSRKAVFDPATGKMKVFVLAAGAYTEAAAASNQSAAIFNCTVTGR